jgi:hypothetical protein
MKMAQARKIYYKDEVIGTEVTDAELTMVPADDLIEAIHNSNHDLCWNREGKLGLINSQDDGFHYQGGERIKPREFVAARKIYFRENRNEYELMGTAIDDDEFYALSADELREAIEGSYHDTGFFRDSDGELIVVSTDESDTELTEDEIKALSADEMRTAILNEQYYDVYRDGSGELTVFYTADGDWGIEDEWANGGIYWGPLHQRTHRDLAAAE